jgi:hypothetical protein
MPICPAPTLLRRNLHKSCGFIVFIAAVHAPHVSLPYPHLRVGSQGDGSMLAAVTSAEHAERGLLQSLI